MTKEVTLRQAGGSVSATLPKDMADRLRLEAGVLKDNPLLIQKIIAERLSDKVQIMMVPNDGKYFFANDVLRSAGLTAAPPTARPE